MNAPSLQLQVLSLAFSHLSLRLGLRMPCHFVIMVIGGGFLVNRRFLPLLKFHLKNYHVSSIELSKIHV